MKPLPPKRLLFAAAIAASALLFADPAAVLAAEPEIGVRNVQVVKTAHEHWIAATGYNSSDRHLPVVSVTFEILDKDGQALVVQSSEAKNIGPGEAWRIWELIPADKARHATVVNVRSFEDEPVVSASKVTK